MAHVVEYDEFLRLSRRVDALEKELEFWKSLMTGQKYLTRIQTMKALGCSSATLNRLTNKGVLGYEKPQRKIRYLVDSVRSYLTTKRIDPFYIDRSIIEALHGSIEGNM